MINFHDMQLPDFIHSYIIGGPTFDTSIIQSLSGRESRYPNFAIAIYKYSIKNCRLSIDELAQLHTFFLNCKGAALGFRIKDYTDYQGINQLLEPEEHGSSIYHLYKHYTCGNRSYKRRITKPIRDTVHIFLNNHQLTSEVDYVKGTVNIPLVPKNNDTVSANFEFDVPVRFCTDSLKYSYAKDGSILLEDIEIKEIII